MELWLIEPHDPLIVRDGKPFGPNPGARASSLSFPFPSTTTGGIRSRAGMNDDGVFEIPDNKEKRIEKIGNLKKIKVRGPLLVQLKEGSNEIAENQWLVPAPQDALMLEPKSQSDEENNEKKEKSEKQGIVRQLVPLLSPGEAETDFKYENQGTLMLVGLAKNDDRSKPLKDAPHYWHWNVFQQWLLNPLLYDGQPKLLAELGHRGPEREHRLHVSIDASRRAAKEGALFETSGLEFTHAGDRQQRLSEAQQLALAIMVDEATQYPIREGTTCFAGERRIVSWRKSNSQLPECHPDIRNAIVTQKACRVILLTPAYFEQGYRPTWLIDPNLEHNKDVKPKLEAIAIQRPQVVSGWDFDIKRPKPTRRLAPAGTVLFLKLEGTSEAIGTWFDNIWMQCVSDDENNTGNSDNSEQYRNDGFGLAVLGTWSGKPEKMQEGQES